MSDLSRTTLPSLVDSHVHLFDPQQRRYPWLTDVPTINQPHLLRDYQAALNGITVDSFVFVEVAAHDEDGLDEARWVASLGEDEPWLGAIVAQARLERGMAVREELDQLAQIELVHGVRRIIAAPFQSDPEFCLRPAFLEAVRLLPEYGFSFDIGVSAVDLSNVASLVQELGDVAGK
jgi:L-fuconolactonase